MFYKTYSKNRFYLQLRFFFLLYLNILCKHCTHYVAIIMLHYWNRYFFVVRSSCWQSQSYCIFGYSISAVCFCANLIWSRYSNHMKNVHSMYNIHTIKCSNSLIPNFKIPKWFLFQDWRFNFWKLFQKSKLNSIDLKYKQIKKIKIYL